MAVDFVFCTNILRNRFFSHYVHFCHKVNLRFSLAYLQICTHIFQGLISENLGFKNFLGGGFHLFGGNVDDWQPLHYVCNVCHVIQWCRCYSCQNLKCTSIHVIGVCFPSESASEKHNQEKKSPQTFVHLLNFAKKCVKHDW